MGTDDFVDDTLVGVEVVRKAGVATNHVDIISSKSPISTREYILFLDEHPGSSLHGLRSYSSLKTTHKSSLLRPNRRNPGRGLTMIAVDVDGEEEGGGSKGERGKRGQTKGPNRTDRKRIKVCRC